MDTEQQAVAVLRQAEAGLRELVSVAASAGDYDSVVKIAAWAKVVGDMAKAPPAITSPASTCADARAVPRDQKLNPKRAKVSKYSRGPSAQYPRFIRQKDQLVRIAWSKREKKEYHHKAPHAILQALVKAMSEFGKDGRIFSTDDLLPIHDTDGNAVPSYQAYVGIALLKHTSLLDQHGRQGYSIPRLAEFADTVEAVWQKLPHR
jgi:hypothetical protein